MSVDGLLSVRRGISLLMGDPVTGTSSPRTTRLLFLVPGFFCGPPTSFVRTLSLDTRVSPSTRLRGPETPYLLTVPFTLSDLVLSSPPPRGWFGPVPSTSRKIQYNRISLSLGILNPPTPFPHIYKREVLLVRLESLRSLDGSFVTQVTPSTVRPYLSLLKFSPKSSVLN